MITVGKALEDYYKQFSEVSFGERLKGLRQSKKLSQEKLGKEFGLSQSTIAYYESDKQEPSFKILKEMAKFFNVSTDFLLLGKVNIPILTLPEDSILLITKVASSYFPDLSSQIWSEFELSGYGIAQYDPDDFDEQDYIDYDEDPYLKTMSDAYDYLEERYKLRYEALKYFVQLDDNESFSEVIEFIKYLLYKEKKAESQG